MNVSRVSCGTVFLSATDIILDSSTVPVSLQNFCFTQGPRRMVLHGP